MRNKYSVWKGFHSPANHSESRYPPMEKTWWTFPGVDGLPKLLQELIPHSGGHKRTENNISRTAGLGSCPEAQERLGCAAGQRSEAQKQIYQKEKDETERVWSTTLNKLQKPSSVAELKQFCNEEQAKYPPRR